MKTLEKNMNLNRETAMRLWNKRYGKSTTVKDFTGREMAKGAYNDRNSKKGWNVDHILPQSKGGTTAEHNLAICNIQTNDEKADKFPSFKANGIVFDIVKVQNHYEYRQRGEKEKVEEDDGDVNFMDATSGIHFFKKLKGIQNKPRFVGSILIRLKEVKSTALIDMIEKYFDKENISYSMSKDYYSSVTRIVVKNYNMPFKDDIAELLDKCIVLNTYFDQYYLPMDYISGYDIIFRVDYYEKKEEMYIQSQKIDFKEIENTRFDNKLFINELVWNNSEAKEKIEFVGNDYTAYHYVYTELSKNLEKEVKGQ
ncbi:MAG: HNH endonuclease [Bacilli bacterium]|nr:HNH endonuclease [Bacilli bacterium]